MSSEILISVRPNQTRVAYLEDRVLLDYKVDQTTSPTLVGSVYRGKVLRVLPGMQAAFVDVGFERSGFLYVGDVVENIQDIDSAMPSVEVDDGDVEEASTRQIPKTPIQDLLKAGDMILVQVAKDPLGTKGARLTTHISLPGRNLVYMPKVEHLGVSRKIEDESERERLINAVASLDHKGGIIVRTAGEGASRDELKLDLNYLGRVWEDIQTNYKNSTKVGSVYCDMDVELRAIRDLLNESVDTVVVDSQEAFEKIDQFLTQFMPDFKNKLQLYSEPEPLFDLYDVDLEISRSLQRKIWLKSGGYIVIDEAEALVVIDVNTGRFVGKKDLEDTILKTNIEAVKEITHQLRIRNCGGIIILDLIDMEKDINREKVLKLLEEELKKDRARTAIISMSELGLVEMTRKRIRPSLVSSLCEPCPYCEGKGYVKQKMTVANEIFQALEREATIISKGTQIRVNCHGDVADWIYEEESPTLEFVEKILGQPLVFEVQPDFHIEEFEIHKTMDL